MPIGKRVAGIRPFPNKLAPNNGLIASVGFAAPRDMRNPAPALFFSHLFTSGRPARPILQLAPWLQAWMEALELVFMTLRPGLTCTVQSCDASSQFFFLFFFPTVFWLALERADYTRFTWHCNKQVLHLGTFFNLN